MRGGRPTLGGNGADAPTHKNFSGKKKKQQLQEKRKKKQEKQQNQRAECDENNEYREHFLGKARSSSNSSSNSEGSEGSEDGETLAGNQKVANHLLKYGADRKGVRSVFQKESKEEIEARKKLSYEPLDRREFHVSGIPYGSWFLMPWGTSTPAKQPKARVIRDAAVQKLIREAAATSSPSFPFSVTIPSRVVSLGDMLSTGASEGLKEVADVSGEERTEQQPPAEELESDSSSAEEETADTACKRGASDPNPIEMRENRFFAAYVACIDRFQLPDPLRGMQVSSFERNPDVWRQLWRTVELSDVVVVVADARYPIVHLPLSLLHFIIKENKKECVVVLNKADLVPESVLKAWVRFLQAYFRATGLVGESGVSSIPIQLFTALPAAESAIGQDEEDTTRRRKKKKRTQKMYEQLKSGKINFKAGGGIGNNNNSDESDDSEDDEDEDFFQYDAGENFKGKEKVQKELHQDKRDHKELQAVAKLITALLDVCKGRCTAHKRRLATGAQTADASGEGNGEQTDLLHVGFVGHPNVGKSSLINCIRGTKVVSVSSTAGHTKHVQTIILPDDGVTLVDCPGLAFPVFGLPRPLQAVIGTHQIAQSRDPQSSVAYLASHLQLEKLFGLRKVEDDDTMEWSAYEFCESYATKKGFFVKRGKGALDTHRAAIAILQEAFEGRLPLFFAPPALEMLTSNDFLVKVMPFLMMDVNVDKQALVS